MKIITHNTWSFLPVRQWWLRPFAWIGRCQGVTDSEQYFTDNVSGFDLRVRFDDNGTPHFCHGLLEYRGDVRATLTGLNELVDLPFTVRVLLETTPFMSMEARKDQEELFYFFCHRIENDFLNLTFWGGWPRDRWGQKIYEFTQQNLDIEEHHGSVSGNKLNCLWLKRWAKKNNAAAITGCKKEFCMIDFIE